MTDTLARMRIDVFTQVPHAFGWLTEQGIDEDEQRRVFNVGIGMCAVVADPPPGALVIGELR